MTLVEETFRVLKKEFLQERQSRFFLNSVFMFSFLLILILVFPFAKISVSEDVKNILFWVILYFSTLSGFQSIFTKESDRKTVLYLKSHFSDLPVFWGKSLFNMIVFFIIISIILIIYSIIFNFELILDPVIFSFLVLTIISLGINGTLLSALLSFSQHNAALYAIIGFPLLFPIFLIGINATTEFMSLGHIELMTWVSVFCYMIMSILIAYLTFEFIWEHMN